MRLDNNNDVFTIFLTGEIDAQNAPTVQEELNNLLKERINELLVFDAKDLSYISSAGLRMLLSVQKETGQKLSVVNISPEVMDIFEMAGFQHIMELKSS